MKIYLTFMNFMESHAIPKTQILRRFRV